MRYLVSEPCATGLHTSSREELHEMIDEILDRDIPPEVIEIEIIEED